MTEFYDELETRDPAAREVPGTPHPRRRRLTMTKSSPVAVAEPTSAPSTTARLCAEAFGTFLLVFGVAGAAIFAAGFNEGKGGLNIGFLGVSLALGLTVTLVWLYLEILRLLSYFNND